MKSISLRGIDDELAARLTEAARSRKKSVNQFVLDTLRKHTGLDKEKTFTRRHHDLDDLFGKWTEEEFAKIQGQIDGESRIDPELWK